MGEWASGRILLRSLSYAGHGGRALTRQTSRRELSKFHFPDGAQ
jgi:hypothetical protein